MDAEQLDAIRARAEAATEGPWEATTGRQSKWSSMYKSRNLRGVQRWPEREWVAHYVEPADAEFIAAARTDVPVLVAEVERLRREADGRRLNAIGFLNERDDLAEQVERVRALHIDDAHGDCDHDGCEAICRACLDPWPCPTIRALDADVSS